MIHEARKRDRLRDKLPDGRRLLASERAKELVDGQVKQKDHKDEDIDRQAREGLYDPMMRRAHRASKGRMEIKTMVL